MGRKAVGQADCQPAPLVFTAPSNVAVYTRQPVPGIRTAGDPGEEQQEIAPVWIGRWTLTEAIA